MRDHNHIGSLGTYVQVRGEASWELGEVRIAGQCHHGAASIRILALDVLLLPIMPDLVNHLRDRMVREM